MKAFYFCLVNVAHVSWARLVDFCVFLFSAAFILGNGEGGNSDFTEMLNLERLEKVRMCIRGLSSFSVSRHLKRLICGHACQTERTMPGHEKPLCPSPQWISQVSNLCTLWHIKTIYLYLSFEVYIAEVAVGGVFWSRWAQNTHFKIIWLFLGVF